jgi:hypothetical protein
MRVYVSVCVCMTKLERRDGLRVNEIMLNVFNVVAIYYYNIALLLQVHSVFSLSLLRRAECRAPHRRRMMHYHISNAIIYRLLLLAYIYRR